MQWQHFFPGFNRLLWTRSCSWKVALSTRGWRRALFSFQAKRAISTSGPSTAFQTISKVGPLKPTKGLENQCPLQSRVSHHICIHHANLRLGFCNVFLFELCAHLIQFYWELTHSFHTAWYFWMAGENAIPCGQHRNCPICKSSVLQFLALSPALQASSMQATLSPRRSRCSPWQPMPTTQRLSLETPWDTCTSGTSEITAWNLLTR